MAYTQEGSGGDPHAVDDSETVLDLYRAGLDYATALGILAAGDNAESRYDNQHEDVEIPG